ncbi:MAG: bifunctional pyr operon transcriptional regulator/uracil phosphoribosyltransferase PyrR [Phycisphaerae bacterium]
MEAKVLLDAEGIAGALERMAEAIAAVVPGGSSVGVVGIRSRGDVLAERLIGLLARRGVREVAHGALDITLYRDDLAGKGGTARVKATQIEFDITERLIVLVDDVLFTGRTVRAALDALADLGRPRAVRLAVLVDRGGRELPIQADFVGLRLERSDRHVRVLLREVDGQERVEAR